MSRVFRRLGIAVAATLIGVTGTPDILPGVWTLVANGDGYADYYCSGHAYNVFRVNGGSGGQFGNTCG